MMACVLDPVAIKTDAELAEPAGFNYRAPELLAYIDRLPGTFIKQVFSADVSLHCESAPSVDIGQ